MPKPWTAERREKERKKLEGSAQWKSAQQESLSVSQEEDEQGQSKRPRRTVKPSSKAMESGLAAAAPQISSGVGAGSSASVTASRAPAGSTGASPGSAEVPGRISKGKRKRTPISVLDDEDDGDKEASTAAVSSRDAGGSSNGGGRKKRDVIKRAVKKKTVAKTKKPAVVIKKKKKKKKKKGDVAAVRKKPKKKGNVVPDAEQGTPSSLIDHDDSASVLAPPVLDIQESAEAPVIDFETESAEKKSDIGLGISILANAAGTQESLLVQPAEETAADVAADIATPPSLPDAGEVEAGDARDESMEAAGILFSSAQGANGDIEAEARAAAAILFSLTGGRAAGHHEAVAQVDEAREGECGAGGYRAEAMGEWEDDEL